MTPEEELTALLTAFMEDARVQINARSSDPLTAQTRANTAIVVLDGIVQTQINGLMYHTIEALQRPAFRLMRDDNNRVIFTSNFAVRRAATS